MSGNSLYSRFMFANRPAVDGCASLLGILLILSCMHTQSGFGQCRCPRDKQPVGLTEQVNYNIRYRFGPLWVDAGEACFSAEHRTYHGEDAIHLLSTGRTLKKYEWFFKVRDTYESYVTANRFRSLYFGRDVQEASHFLVERHVYDTLRNRVFCLRKQRNGEIERDTLNLSPCSADILAAIYKTRCLDFDLLTPGDTVFLNVVVDGAAEDLYIRYLGKSTIDHETFGKIRCDKFSVYLIKGTIFKGGEGMTVWSSDDGNHLPVYVESEILIGKIQAWVTNFKSLRFPLNTVD